jgi:hypothetical protein
MRDILASRICTKHTNRSGELGTNHGSKFLINRHGAKVAAFAVVGVCVTERVKHIGYLLWEGLGNIEAVAADVEEGAAVIEAVLEVGQVVADTVEGAEPPDKARGDLLTESR